MGSSFRFSPTEDVNDSRPITAPNRNLNRWVTIYYLSISLTLLSVLGLGLWGVSHDLNQVRETFIDSEMQRLRSHAQRTVVRILDEQNRLNHWLDEPFREEAFLRKHWQRRKDKSRLYSAVVDPSGQVFMHTNPDQEGKQLEIVWYQRVVSEAGDDVVDTSSPDLTGGQRALDVRVPIVRNGKQVGTYHTGLAYAWFEKELKDRKDPIKRAWTLILASTLAVLLIAGYSLAKISRRNALLHEAKKLTQARRFAEIGQFAIAIFQEVRNPLNAMRLNLHALARRQNNSETNSDAAAVDQTQIVRETCREIDSLERMVSALMAYGRYDQPQPRILDLRSEIESTLAFLSPIMEKSGVLVRARFPNAPAILVMDPHRLRQILINLIANSKEATGSGGRIDISVNTIEEEIEIVVADDGPGVSLSDQERLFDFFFSTKETGTGLGLALVRCYVQEAGGSVTFEHIEPCGARFRLRFNQTVKLNNLGMVKSMG